MPWMAVQIKIKSLMPVSRSLWLLTAQLWVDYHLTR